MVEAGAFKSPGSLAVSPGSHPSPAFKGQASLRPWSKASSPELHSGFHPNLYTSGCRTLGESFQLGTLCLPLAFFHRHEWKIVCLQKEKQKQKTPKIGISIASTQPLRTRTAASVPEGFPRTFSILSFRDTICFSSWSFSSTWVSYLVFHSLPE